MVSSMKISQREPVRFRVLSLDPNPLPAALAGPNDYIVLIQRAETDNRMKINFAFRGEDLAPYVEAIREAIRTQDVYWVDWNYETVGAFGHKPHDSTDWRMLRAVANRQLVSPGEEA